VEVDSTTTHSRPGNAIVDDTTSGVANEDITMEPVKSSRTPLSPEEEALFAKVEEIIQFLLDYLQVTCGDLAP
jgi:hypothetical protein